MIDSHILRSQSDSPTSRGGGCFHLSGGDLHLISSVVEDSSSLGSGGLILSVPSGTLNEGPLFVATFTEFRQRACDRPLFSQQGLAQIVLRSITFTPLDGCDTTALASDTAVDGLDTKGCGQTYTDRRAESWGVCSSRSPDACTVHAAVGTILESLECTCPAPELINPNDADPLFAPYRSSGGCITPMKLADVVVARRMVEATLSKPASGLGAGTMERNINVTLHLEGDDIDRPANWSVLDASLIQNRCTWLQLPSTAGGTDPLAISEGSGDVTIPLVLSAYNLRERAAPYEETLPIHVQSALKGVSRTEHLKVSLTIRASTSFVVWSFAVWGRTAGEQRCVQGTDRESLDRDLVVSALSWGDATVDRRIQFAACDAERIPVDHPLPSWEDQRAFIAYLKEGGRPHMKQTMARVTYIGNGLYDVSVRPTTYGAFSVELQLGRNTI
eukprot:3977917-Prymnesium_polylepis.1